MNLIELHEKEASLVRRIEQRRKDRKAAGDLEREHVKLKCKIIRAEMRNERKAA